MTTQGVAFYMFLTKEFYILYESTVLSTRIFNIYFLKNETCHIFSKCFNRAFEDEPENPGLGARQTNFKAVLC